MNKCEKCSEDGHYVVELNRTLCNLHAKELTAKHGVYSESTKAMEYIVFDMTTKYKHQLSEKEISDILKDISKRVFYSNQDYQEV